MTFICCQLFEKTKIKKKEPVNGPFLKREFLQTEEGPILASVALLRSDRQIKFLHLRHSPIPEKVSVPCRSNPAFVTIVTESKMRRLFLHLDPKFNLRK